MNLIWKIHYKWVPCFRDYWKKTNAEMLLFDERMSDAMELHAYYAENVGKCIEIKHTTADMIPDYIEQWCRDAGVDDKEEALSFYKDEKLEELDHDVVSMFHDWGEDDDDVRLSNTMSYMKLPIRFRFYTGETELWERRGMTVELRSFESPLCF